MSDQDAGFRRAYDSLLEQMPEPPEFDELTTFVPVTAARAPRPSRIALMAGVAGAVLVIGALAVSQGSTPSVSSGGSVELPAITGTTAPNLHPTVPAIGHPFGVPLPWTLVLDNGSQIVLSLDTATGISYGKPIPGQRPGDQPYRLTLVDGNLVVGWGSISSYDVSFPSSLSLGEATLYVPAAETDRVWLVDYDGNIGPNIPQVWQVSIDGDRLTEPVPLDVVGSPAIGVPGGLAVETDSGIAIWDLATQSVTQRLGQGQAFVSDVTADGRLAWCTEPCTEMHVTDLTTEGDLTVRHPFDSRPLEPRAARFSDDGQLLAVLGGKDVVVANTSCCDAVVAMTFDSGVNPTYLNWAPASHELFASTYSYGARSTTLGYYDASTGYASVVEYPRGGSLGFVVLPTRDASSLLFRSGFECPVTVPWPQPGFTPPEPWSPSRPADEGMAWYGTDGLWTVLPLEPGDYGRRKSVWWSVNFPGGAVEESPDITVTWRRLDADRPSISEIGGTNASTSVDGWFMIGGIDPEETGCWAVTASYKGATLSYVYDNR